MRFCSLVLLALLAIPAQGAKAADATIIVVAPGLPDGGIVPTLSITANAASPAPTITAPTSSDRHQYRFEISALSDTQPYYPWLEIGLSETLPEPQSFQPTAFLARIQEQATAFSIYAPAITEERCVGNNSIFEYANAENQRTDALTGRLWAYQVWHRLYRCKLTAGDSRYRAEVAFFLVQKFNNLTSLSPALPSALVMEAARSLRSDLAAYAARTPGNTVSRMPNAAHKAEEYGDALGLFDRRGIDYLTKAINRARAGIRRIDARTCLALDIAPQVLASIRDDGDFSAASKATMTTQVAAALVEELACLARSQSAEADLAAAKEQSRLWLEDIKTFCDANCPDLSRLESAL